MIDINYYRQLHNLKLRILAGEKPENVQYIMESFRSETPVVYNIETTNACNMVCPFCPRTTLMTRPVKTMNPELFERVIDQLRPWTDDEWNRWKKFVAKRYGIAEDHEPHENHFFLYVIPKVIVLHGYGDPLLDPHIPDYVGMMTDRGLLSYFSCNPANIQMDKTEKAFANGLDYIKYSIDSTSMSVRGKDNFTPDLERIFKVILMKRRGGYKTQIVITMIDLGQDDFRVLQNTFKNEDVYLYMKSLDQGWMLGTEKPKSIHWSEFCQIPWSSMTIKSDGCCATCEEDYNNERCLGNAYDTPLAEIWNGEDYRALRHDHFALTPGIKCTERCDMNPVGRFLK